MNILISAYACEPDKGSEPFLGWRWSEEISKHHHVWILTRDNNRAAIESFLNKNGNPNGIEFIYVSVPKWLSFWKKGELGLKIYYWLWQKAAYYVARRFVSHHQIDIVHHITFGAYTQPTYMHKLGIPFVWGPLGGGERLPRIAGRKLSWKSRIYECVREMQMNITPYLPYAREAACKAAHILVTTEETKALLPTRFYHKLTVFQSLGIDETFTAGTPKSKPTNKIKILMVGRLIGWKGFDIGIKAFKQLAFRHSNVELFIRGRGPGRSYLEQLCGDDLGKNIFFADDYLQYDEMYGFYTSHHIFVNTSLHDSGCLALLEAMSAGLPIINMNVGGPRVLTTDEYALKVEPEADYQATINSMEAAMEKLVSSPELRDAMGAKAKERVLTDFMYSTKYKVLEDIYQRIVTRD